MKFKNEGYPVFKYSHQHEKKKTGKMKKVFKEAPLGVNRNTIGTYSNKNYEDVLLNTTGR